MSSASTKRRHKRDAALFAEWVGTPIGQRVTVARANGTTLKTITGSGPVLYDGSAMIRVEGIPGNTRLERVTLGWNPAPKAAPKRPKTLEQRLEVEIQRLRAAMVHAIDDCEAALRYPDLPANTRAWLRRAAVGLKAALEKK